MEGGSGGEEVKWEEGEVKHEIIWKVLPYVNVKIKLHTLHSIYC